MTPFYEWSSTASNLEPLRGGILQHERMKKLEKISKTYTE